jgi:hypothetical protein
MSVHGQRWQKCSKMCFGCVFCVYCVGLDGGGFDQERIRDWSTKLGATFIGCVSLGVHMLFLCKHVPSFALCMLWGFQNFIEVFSIRNMKKHRRILVLNQ